MPEPLAYFLTFTTYGSHLPGEPNFVNRRQNGLGESRPAIHSGLAAKSRELMTGLEVLLDRPMRLAIEEAIRQHCEHRGWILRALNVRTNHVHLVVTAENVPISEVLGQLKARATRILRERQLVPQGAPVWARHGSTIVLADDEDLAEVVDYVLFRQGDWLT